MKKKYYLASDHAGYELKEALKEHLKKQGYETVDLGADTDKVPSSYALKGLELGKAVAADKDAYGIGVCGTGIGISIAANKARGVRAARIMSVEDAHLSKQHNNANIITFGGRQTSKADAIKMVDEFNKTEFEGGRHVARVEELDNAK